MTKEYIGTRGARHNLTKYTLTSGVEVKLSDEDIIELAKETDTYEELKQELSDKTDEILVLETKLEHYKEPLRAFKFFQESLDNLRLWEYNNIVKEEKRWIRITLNIVLSIS